jgi:hypothetical protein
VIKFCGNCGTTVTEKELSDSKAVRSGDYVYCQNCAQKLGFTAPAAIPQGGTDKLLDEQDSRGTQKIADDKPKIDLPDDIFEDDYEATKTLSSDDLKNLIASENDQTAPLKRVAPAAQKKKVVCPGCNVKLRIAMKPGEKRKVRCPKCKKVFVAGKKAVQSSAPSTGARMDSTDRLQPVDASKPKEKKSTFPGDLSNVEMEDEATVALSLDELKKLQQQAAPIENDATAAVPVVKKAAPKRKKKATPRQAQLADSALELDGDPLEPLEPVGSDSEPVKAAAPARKTAGKGPVTGAKRVVPATSRATKGLGGLIVLVLIITCLPFMLMGVSSLQTTLGSLGNHIFGGLSKIGINAFRVVSKKGGLEQHSQRFEPYPTAHDNE